MQCNSGYISDATSAFDLSVVLIKHRLSESRGQRIAWLLEELKVNYDIKTYTRLKTKRSPPELAKVHPLGKSPVITIETPKLEKPLVLAESGTIIEFLTDHYGRHLIPKRYPDGQDGIIGAETKEWLRYRVSAHRFLEAIDVSSPQSRNMYPKTDTG